MFSHEQVIATSEFSNNRESSILLFKIHALFFLTEPVVCKSPAVTRMTKHGIMGKTAPSCFLLSPRFRASFYTIPIKYNNKDLI